MEPAAGVRQVEDPVKRESLAPMAAPFAFGCKRVSLEQAYSDRFDRGVESRRRPALYPSKSSESAGTGYGVSG